jgi:hypothetical protein
MNRLITLLFILLSFNSIAQESWKKNGLIPTMSWGGISEAEISESSYRKLKEVGVTIDIAFFSKVDAIAAGLDAAQKAGIKLLISCPELKTATEKTVNRFMNHPALEGYYLGDEPSKNQFEELKIWNNLIQSIDKKHYCFVNLYPNINSNQSKFGTKNYQEYVDDFDKVFPAPYLTFDFYPIVDQALHPRWYENLEFFANKYQKEGRPFWAFALTTSYLAYSNDAVQPSLEDFYQLYKTYKPEKTYVHGIPTLADLRLQVNSNLAYGAQGIEYWSFRGFGSPLDAQGKRTIVFEHLQKLNREIQNLSDIFLGSKLISVAHTGLQIPNGTKRLGNLPASIKLLETHGEGAIVSWLENGKNSFLLIVNRDFKQKMKLIISTTEDVKRIMKTGETLAAQEFSPVTEVEPGDMLIYMVPTNKK